MRNFLYLFSVKANGQKVDDAAVVMTLYIATVQKI